MFIVSVIINLFSKIIIFKKCRQWAVFIVIFFSNLDMAIQMISTIKQVIAMQASLIYIGKNYNNEDILEEDRRLMLKNLQNISRKIKLCKIVTNQLKDRTKQVSV